MHKIPQWITFSVGSSEQGFNQAGMEIFEKEDICSLIREVLQNSTDNPGEGEDQVFVEFKVIEEPFPDPDEFSRILRKCKDYCIEYGQTEDDKSIQFYEEANKFILTPENVKYLKISDYNTTGIMGLDRDRKSGWFRMVESLGVTLGGRSTNGGSKGIGKNAPFNLSKLRTVFYSTISPDGYAFKGIAKLNTFDDDDGNTKGSEIKFCYVNNESVREYEAIPKQFRRKTESFGTDIFVAGFDLEEAFWQKNFIIETIRNYYAAIFSEKLIVKIGDIEISKQTLLYLSDKYLTKKDDTRYFIECLKEIPKETKLDQLGNCQLFIKLDDGFRKKIDYMRNKKMKIFDKHRPYIVENFAAVFICMDDDGSKILRIMEGAEHTFWDPKKRPNGGVKILASIENWIKDELTKLSNINSTDESIVPFTEDLLPMIENGTGSNNSKIIDGQTIEEETGQEILSVFEEPLTVIPTITSFEIQTENIDGKSIIKKRISNNRKNIEKQHKEPKKKSDDFVKKNKERGENEGHGAQRRYFPSENFIIRLIKNDKFSFSFILIVESNLENELTMDIEMIPVGENGEQEKIKFIKSASYSDNKPISLLPTFNKLHKVKISSGVNKYNIITIYDRKLTFNIIGNEN